MSSQRVSASITAATTLERPMKRLHAWTIAALAAASPLTRAADGDLDPSFNAGLQWYGAPGWASIPIDPSGRPLRDAARTIRIQNDDTMIIGGLGGIDPAKDNNGLLTVAKLTPAGEAAANWSNPDNLTPGRLGFITLPHEFDFVQAFSAGFNAGGNHGIGFGGSGRVVTGTVFNRAKTYALAPGGGTLNGGLGVCEMIVGGASRNFYALGTATYQNDTAFITGYVHRYSDQAYLLSNCKISGSEQKVVQYSDGLPGSPPGVIGHVGVAPQFDHFTHNDVFPTSQRLYRNFNSTADNDALVCATSRDDRPPATSTVGCDIFQPNLGGHLDDLLWSIVRIGSDFHADTIAEPVLGLIQSQIESPPVAIGGGDRLVLTLARPRYRYILSNGMAYEDLPALERSLTLVDAANPAGTLSLHYPLGVYDRIGNDIKVWVVMAIRPYPGPAVLTELAVARFNFADLSLDTSFGNGTGWRRYSLGGAELMPETMVMDHDGNLVIAGSRRFNPDNDDWDWFVMRLLARNPDLEAPLLVDGFEDQARVLDQPDATR